MTAILVAMSHIEPDTKDWTWVLDRPCTDCSFDASRIPQTELAVLVRANAELWQDALARPDAAERTRPSTWSVLEYGCHVRDVHRLFDERIGRMLTEDVPTFANWDQDETAVADRYGEQDPALVAGELVAAADAVADRYASVTGGQWARRGVRSNGSEFTVASLGRYHLHDVVHHAWDVTAVR